MPVNAASGVVAVAAAAAAKRADWMREDDATEAAARRVMEVATISVSRLTAPCLNWLLLLLLLVAERS